MSKKHNFKFGGSNKKRSSSRRNRMGNRARSFTRGGRMNTNTPAPMSNACCYESLDTMASCHSSGGTSGNCSSSPDCSCFLHNPGTQQQSCQCMYTGWQQLTGCCYGSNTRLARLFKGGPRPN